MIIMAVMMPQAATQATPPIQTDNDGDVIMVDALDPDRATGTIDLNLNLWRQLRELHWKGINCVLEAK